MLRIKKEIDLNELERFGFEKLDKNGTYFWKIIADRYATVRILKERELFVDRGIFLDYYPASIPEEQFEKAFKEYENILFDLIQAGYVEKVEE